MKKTMVTLVAIVLILCMGTSSLAVAKSDLGSTALERMRLGLKNPTDIAVLNALIQDVANGDAIVVSADEAASMILRSAYSYTTYSDNIRLNNVLLGKFYVKVAFTDRFYEFVDSCRHTKQADVITLDMVSVDYLYYPANNALRCVEEYYCYMNGPYYADGNFLEIDDFYF